MTKVTLDVVMLTDRGNGGDGVIEALKSDPRYLYRVLHASSLDEISMVLSDKDCDLILVDLEAIRFDLSLLADLRVEFHELPLIVFCSARHESRAMEALESGVHDYFLWDHTTTRSIQKTLWTILCRRKLAELEAYSKQLRSTENSFRAVVQRCVHGIVITDDEERFQLVNPSAEALLGLKGSQVFQQKCPLFVGRGETFEMQLCTQPGTHIHVDVQSIPIQWGEKNARLYMLHDISERVQFEKRKDDFLNTVSHELRTPLAIIREGISQVVDGLHGEVSERQGKFLSLSFQASQQLQKIVDDLLDVAKLESGRVRMNRRFLDLREIASDAVESFSSIAAKKGLRIRFIGTKAPAEVYVDRDRVRQVLDNLINNALKFTCQGGIEVSVKATEAWVECSVADSGRGMTPQELSRLFTKFEQFGANMGGQKGTGLGLCIVKNLVELHGGSVFVESEVKQGTRFTLRFPRITVWQLIDQQVRAEVQISFDAQDSFSLLAWDEGRTPPKGKKPEDILRGGYDQVFRDGSWVILLLPSTPKDGALAVIERLRSFYASIGNPARTSRFETATYPESGTEVEELLAPILRVIQKEATHEKENSHHRR